MRCQESFLFDVFARRLCTKEATFQLSFECNKTTRSERHSRLNLGNVSNDLDTELSRKSSRKIADYLDFLGSGFFWVKKWFPKSIFNFHQNSLCKLLKVTRVSPAQAVARICFVKNLLLNSLDSICLRAVLLNHVAGPDLHVYCSKAGMCTATSVFGHCLSAYEQCAGLQAQLTWNIFRK